MTSADGTIAALLGASPGGSTAVSIMIEVLQRCFPAQWATAGWRTRIAAWIPSLG